MAFGVCVLCYCLFPPKNLAKKNGEDGRACGFVECEKCLKTLALWHWLFQAIEHQYPKNILGSLLESLAFAACVRKRRSSFSDLEKNIPRPMRRPSQHGKSPERQNSSESKRTFLNLGMNNPIDIWRPVDYTVLDATAKRRVLKSMSPKMEFTST